ncbi:hypothetical protein [Streptomyces sp. KL116D]|uniref:hypothetical protein n=1 Tax=Streptomyces sp. KL116D TaxID=3045152 RepID=UPI003558FE01
MPWARRFGAQVKGIAPRPKVLRTPRPRPTGDTGIARSSHRSHDRPGAGHARRRGHTRPGRGVVAHIAVNVVLLAVAVVVAWGRFGPYA